MHDELKHGPTPDNNNINNNNYHYKPANMSNELLQKQILAQLKIRVSVAPKVIDEYLLLTAEGKQSKFQSKSK